MNGPKRARAAKKGIKRHRNGSDRCGRGSVAWQLEQAPVINQHLPLVCAEAEAYRRLTRAAKLAARGEGNEKGTAPRALAARAAQSEPVLQTGTLLLERAAHRSYIREQRVELTPREFLLLEYLMTNVNVALTRDQILDNVWGINFDTGTNMVTGTHMVDVSMHFLCRKLAAYGLKDMIQTVRGYGYRLIVHA